MNKDYKKATKIIDQTQAKLFPEDALFQVIEKHKKYINNEIQIF